METLVVFLIVFLPFGWFMWVTLRFTRDTIGENSPLKVRRIYYITEWQYFVNLNSLMLYFLMGMGVILLRLSFTMYVSYTVSNPLLARLFVLFLAIELLVLSIYMIAIDINHWKYIQGVVIETIPEEHALEITFTDEVYRIRAGDITRAAIISNGNRHQIGYAIYYFSNGDYFIIPDAMPGSWVIREYFKDIPVNRIRQRFPFIR